MKTFERVVDTQAFIDGQRFSPFQWVQCTRHAYEPFLS
jgi:hypothetical protein